MKRYCLALDLIDNPKLIAEYKAYHKQVWPEILKSLKDSGIKAMEIYCRDNRLFMIMETEDSFDFSSKKKKDSENPYVQKWETLMWDYQKALPSAKPNEKWVLMEAIFKWSA